jgi:hypothetical protein
MRLTYGCQREPPINADACVLEAPEVEKTAIKEQVCCVLLEEFATFKALFDVVIMIGLSETLI